jgi:ubiquitin-conjugating enzyme E2 H
MSDYHVDISEENTTEFHVRFNAPRDTPYEGGVWRVRVTIPDAYPYKSPGIGFPQHSIFHPNIDEGYGRLIIDV